MINSKFQNVNLLLISEAAFNSYKIRLYTNNNILKTVK